MPDSRIVDVEETGDTLAFNAYLKAKAYYDYVIGECSSINEDTYIIGEDTGLFVDALNGRPGVKAKRYAGENATSDENINKLLSELRDSCNRCAYFETVLCIFNKDGILSYLNGVCEGSISKTPLGDSDFGYERVFIPKGHNVTFAQMDKSVKASISHRAVAVKKMVKFLKSRS